MNQQKKKYFFLCLSVFLIFVLFYFDLIHKTYVIPIIPETNTEGLLIHKTWSEFKFFGDTQVIFLFAECHKTGHDVFIINECGLKYGIRHEGYQFQYGRSLLLLPIIDTAYREIFLISYGSLLISLLIYLVFKLINPKSIYENIFCVILIVNPTTLLLFERLNFDLLVFLLLVLMIFLKKNYIIKLLINFFLFTIKYYPFLFIINFFVEDRLGLKKKLYYIILFLSLSLIFFFINFNDFILIKDNVSNNGRNIRYNFSLNGMGRVFEYMLITINQIFEFSLKNNISATKILLLSLLILISLLNYFFSNKKILLNNEYNSRKKLFYVCSNTLIILYILFNNNYLREVFFIGVIPYLLIMSKSNCSFSMVCSSLIFCKYLFMIIVWPSILFTDLELNLLGQFFIVIKILLDFIIISLLITYILKMNLLIFRDSLKSINL